jgi:hypothetical protein
MMERPDKVKKIRKDYEAARQKRKDHYEAIIYVVEQNKDCTSQEFFKAIYPINSLYTWARSDATEKLKRLFAKLLLFGGKELWRIDKHTIAKDVMRFPDHRIIAVRREIKQLDGTVITYNAQGFAHGEDALNAIPRRRITIKGIYKEIEDYQQKASDQNLQRRLAVAKRRRAKEIGGSN